MGTGWLRRRGWIVIFTTLAAALLASAFSAGRATTYSATAAFVVTEEGGGGAGGTEQKAQAQSIIFLVPNDDAIVRRVSEATAIDQTTVRTRMTASVLTQTSIFLVTYRGDTAEQPPNALLAVQQAITGPAPVTPGITPDSVQFMNMSVVTKSTASGVTVPVGVIAGLILGIALIVVLERADPRADDADDLARETGAPVTEIETSAPGALAAAVERWGALARRPAPDIALLALTPATSPATDAVAGHLVAAVRSTGVPLDVAVRPASELARNDGTDRDAARLLEQTGRRSVKLVVSQAPGPMGEGEGELVAVSSDLVVLVVARGARVRTVRNAVRNLEQFGAQPAWCVLVSRSFRGAMGGAAPLPDSVPPVATRP